MTGILDQDGAPRAIVAVVRSLPWSQVVLSLFCLVSLIFMATTYDSVAYTLALGLLCTPFREAVWAST